MSWIVKLFKTLLSSKAQTVTGTQDVVNRAKIYADIIPKGEGAAVTIREWPSSAMSGKYLWDVKDGKAELIPQTLSFEIGFVKVLSVLKGWTVKGSDFYPAQIPVKVNYKCSLLDGKYVFRGSTTVFSGFSNSVAKIEARITSPAEIPVERDGNQFMAGPLAVDVEVEAYPFDLRGGYWVDGYWYEAERIDVDVWRKSYKVYLEPSPTTILLPVREKEEKYKFDKRPAEEAIAESYPVFPSLILSSIRDKMENEWFGGRETEIKVVSKDETDDDREKPSGPSLKKVLFDFEKPHGLHYMVLMKTDKDTDWKPVLNAKEGSSWGYIVPVGDGVEYADIECYVFPRDFIKPIGFYKPYVTVFQDVLIGVGYQYERQYGLYQGKYNVVGFRIYFDRPDRPRLYSCKLGVSRTFPLRYRFTNYPNEIEVEKPFRFSLGVFYNGDVIKPDVRVSTGDKISKSVFEGAEVETIAVDKYSITLERKMAEKVVPESGYFDGDFVGSVGSASQGSRLFIVFRGIRKPNGFTVFLGDETPELVYEWADGKWVLKTT